MGGACCNAEKQLTNGDINMDHRRITNDDSGTIDTTSTQQPPYPTSLSPALSTPKNDDKYGQTPTIILQQSVTSSIESDEMIEENESPKTTKRLSIETAVYSFGGSQSTGQLTAVSLNSGILMRANLPVHHDLGQLSINLPITHTDMKYEALDDFNDNEMARKHQQRQYASSLNDYRNRSNRPFVKLKPVPIPTHQPFHFSQSLPDTDDRDDSDQFGGNSDDEFRYGIGIINSHKSQKQQARHMKYGSSPLAGTPIFGDSSMGFNVDGIFLQVTELKRCKANEVLPVLDNFLADWDEYKSSNSVPWRYLFSHGVISNLIHCWNLGIITANVKLIKYSIDSLCKFTNRDEFRAPFLAADGIRYIDSTLCIPSLQTPKENDYLPQTNMPVIESADSVNFGSDSFDHILSVLKITREICRLQVIDTMLWCNNKIYEKILDCMKSNYDEEMITIQCRNTLICLLQASYEIGEEILEQQQIHDMIDSFLESTRSEHATVLASTMHLNNISSNSSESRGASVASYAINLQSGLSGQSSTRSIALLQQHSSDTNGKMIHLHKKHKKLLGMDEIDEQSQLDNANTNNLKIRKMSIVTDYTENTNSDANSSDFEEASPRPCDNVSDDFDEDDDSYAESNDSHLGNAFDQLHHGSMIITQHQINDSADIADPAEFSAAISDMNMTNVSQKMSVVRISSRRSFISNASASDSVRTQIIDVSNSACSTPVIMSMEEYDEIYEQHINMDDLPEASESSSSDQGWDYENEEKSFTTDPKNFVSPSTDASFWTEVPEDMLAIELKPHQLLYINSLFWIIYKIVTLNKGDDEDNQRPASVRGPNESFMDILRRARSNQSEKQTSEQPLIDQHSAGENAFSHTVNFSIRSSTKITRSQNKLLEIFYSSISFKNMLKLLKCYNIGAGASLNSRFLMKTPMSNVGSLGNMRDVVSFESNMSEQEYNAHTHDHMVSLEMIGCKLLRKIMVYSPRYMDSLLDSQKLDLISVLVNLLQSHNSNVDITIYVLDIMCKITKSHDATREAMLDPKYFDRVIQALDKWWTGFYNSSHKIAQIESPEFDLLEKKEEEKQIQFNLKPKSNKQISFRAPMIERTDSTKSIVIGERTDMSRSASVNDAELFVEVTIAMLRFFSQLSQTNAFDLLEYEVEIRIQAILNYYNDISLTYDKVDADDDSIDDINEVNFLYLFTDPKHLKCLTLCLDAIEHLANDIYVCVEMVKCNETCEQLSRLMWSLRDNGQMIKKFCKVIKHLLQHYQTCEIVVNQHVIGSLVELVKYGVQKAFHDYDDDDDEDAYDDDDDGHEYIAQPTSESDTNSYSAPHRINGIDEDAEDSDNVEYNSPDARHAKSHDLLMLSPVDSYTHNSNRDSQKRSSIKKKHVRFGRNSISYSLTMRTSGVSVSGNIKHLKDVFEVFTAIACIDAIRKQIIESDLMPLLLELISNKSMHIQNDRMMPYTLSNLILELTKSKIIAKEMLESEQYSISKFIGAAIETNRGNNGVIAKYYLCLRNMKKGDPELFNEQLQDTSYAKDATIYEIMNSQDDDL